jgi:hypothetical protein
MRTEKEIKVLEHIIQTTEKTGQFSSSNRTISLVTKLTPSQVGTTIGKLAVNDWFNKYNKSRYDASRGFMGTTRTIQIDLDKAKEFIKTINSH